MLVDERRLVGRAVRGDEAAFACLIEHHQRSIYQLCYRLLGDAAEAEDAAQETFLRAFLHLRRFDRTRSLRTWLCAIAHHHCIDLLRRRRLVWLSLESDPPLEHVALRDRAPAPEREVEQREQAAQVQRLLNRLPPASRAVIALHYWSGLSYREIARATGSTVSAVKSRLHRSRAMLAAHLAAERQAAPTRWQSAWELP